MMDGLRSGVYVEYGGLGEGIGEFGMREVWKVRYRAGHGQGRKDIGEILK